MKKFSDKLSSENTKKIFKEISSWLIGGAIGAIIGAFLAGYYLWSIIFAFLILVNCFVYFKVCNNLSSKHDIKKIIDSEFNAENYVQVIRVGYTLSRFLHLSGRNELRYSIGEMTNHACDKLNLSDTIRIENNNKSIASIKAKTLIDDLGWTSYKRGFTEIAIENITKGIEIAKNNSELILQLKGYRHLIGIYDDCEKQTERDNTINESKQLIESDDYKKLFVPDDYKHNVAEFDYAVARTLIDDKPDEALKIALDVKKVFSDSKTSDMERYVKTFDLIGDIYANYGRPEKLKQAKDAYIEGIAECKKYGRSERMIRITIDYISLLIKMLNTDNVYESASWENLDKEEFKIYQEALACIGFIENDEYLIKLKKIHKKYKKQRKWK